MADLKTNYVDDVLDTTKNQLRKYQQIQNDDGTVSFVDVTEYTQVGTSFGAKDINDTNAAINDVNGKLIKYKDFNFTNLSNTKSDIYYLTLSDNISSDIDDGSIVVLSAQILFWTSIGGEILNVSYDDFAKTLKLLFPRGSIFQKGQVQVRCTYIKNLD